MFVKTICLTNRLISMSDIRICNKYFLNNFLIISTYKNSDSPCEFFSEKSHISQDQPCGRKGSLFYQARLRSPLPLRVANACSAHNAPRSRWRSRAAGDRAHVAAQRLDLGNHRGGQLAQVVEVGARADVHVQPNQIEAVVSNMEKRHAHPLNSENLEKVTRAPPKPAAGEKF